MVTKAEVMGIFFLNIRLPLHSFCKVISHSLNTKTGFRKGKKGSINTRKTVLKNKEKQKSRLRYKRRRDLVTTLKFLNYFLN